MNTVRKTAKKVIEELDVRKKGLNDGHSNIPETSATLLNDAQEEVVNHYNLNSKSLEVTTSERISKIRSRLGEKDFDTTFDQAKGFHSNALSEVRTVFDSNKAKLLDLSRKRSQAELDLKYFVEVNDLKHHASYPNSQIFHWSIVVLMVVLESLANSYFFAKGSDLGLIGGFFQAVFVSVANIGVALFVGFYWRNKNRELVKAKAYAAMAIYVLFLIGFNLGVAHYRAMLEVSPDSAMQQAIINLTTLSTTFRIDNFDAWILFILGGLFSLAAMFKSYLSDDIFPGYGAVTRKHNLGIKEFDDCVQATRSSVYSTLKEMKSTLESDVNRCRLADKDYPRLIKEIGEIVTQSKQELESYKDDCVLVIKTYRKFNALVRNTPPPSYWENFENFVIDVDFDGFKPTQHEIEFGSEISEKLKTIEAIYFTTIEEFAKTTDEVFDSFEKLIKGIERDGRVNNMIHNN